MSRAAQVVSTVHDLAGRAFARHEVRVLTEDRVVCGRPGSNSYAFEVARLGWGRVIVHGDIEPVVFRGGDGGGLLDRLAWLAGSDRTYLAGKSQDGGREFDSEAFAEDLEGWAEDARQEHRIEPDEEGELDPDDPLAACPLTVALLASGAIHHEPGFETDAAPALEGELARLGATPREVSAWGQSVTTDPWREALWPGLGRRPHDPVRAGNALRVGFLREPAFAPWGRLREGLAAWRARLFGGCNVPMGEEGIALPLSVLEKVEGARELAARARACSLSEHDAHRAARDLDLGWEGGHGYVPRASLLWAHEAARVAFALLRPECLLARFLDAPSEGGLALYNSAVRAHRASDPGRIAAARAEAARDVARVRRAAARGSRP